MSAATILLAVLLALLAGVLSGLFGVGGGILFVPILVALGLGQVEAAATSLLAIVPTAAVGTWRQARYGNIRVRTAVTIGVASIVGVEVGVLIATSLPEHVLRRLFGVLLLGVAAQLALRARASNPRYAEEAVRRVSLLAAPLLAVLIASISAAAAPAQPEARATAVIARIAQPGLPEQISNSVDAPPAADQQLGGYVYPEDGSIVRIGSSSAQVAAQPGVSSSAQARATALAVSLFGGEITADSLDIRATAAAGTANASSDVAGSTITGLTVLGQLITPAPDLVVPLADWGTLEVLGTALETAPGKPHSASAAVAAMRVTLTLDHGGLPVGSVVEIGNLSAAAAVVDAPVKEVKPPPRPVKPPPRPVVPPDAPREPGTSIPGAPAELVRPAPEVTAQLTTGGYVFPIYGPVSFGDTFGAPRADVAGGWHHGEDIFAPLGTPLLAVADGTVFSVGWNDIGGWRLWVRDRVGNEFYYAHLSAYSPLATNGRQVKAGDVLGFMGKTGDAEFSAVHLHFEIHPVSLLARGYDGAVAPYPFLNAWRRAQDVSFDLGRSYLPLDGPAGRAGIAPPAGAVLLEADDISGASGLVPGALAQALSGRAARARTGAQDR